MVNKKSIDGMEIPYAIGAIEMIDPDIVGHATLFMHKGNSIVIAELEGNIRESLIADYKERRADTLPEIIMYSGSSAA